MKAVIGLGFGDEGKGRTTDYLVSKSPNPLVVRFSGGQQAGHTVIYEGKKHIFSSFGSGTLRGAPTYLMQLCTISISGIVNEYEELKKQGITPTLFIDPHCPVTTPYDINHNRWVSARNGHGTCGLGINATHRREEKLYSLLAVDLLYEPVFKEKLRNIGEFYNSPEVDLSGYFEKYRRFKELVQAGIVIITSPVMSPELQSLDCIFEGSQGILLDEEIGFYPNVTASVTGLKNILPIVNEVYYITRCYQTRHGNGFMTNQDKSVTLINNKEEINTTNVYQGDFRTSMLDLDLLQYAHHREKIRNGGKPDLKETLVITCMDQMKKYAFTANGTAYYFKSFRQFGETVKEALGIPDVMYSFSPESKLYLSPDFI